MLKVKIIFSCFHVKDTRKRNMIAKVKFSVIFLYVDPNATIAKQLGCILNNQETGQPVIKLRLESKKRRKRDVEEKGDSDKKSDKTKTTKIPVYGCPTNYDRIIGQGIDLCIRYGEDKDTKKELVIDFEDAKKHCMQDGATLLYFSNFNEALSIRKWLGKNDVYIIQSF